MTKEIEIFIWKQNFLIATSLYTLLYLYSSPLARVGWDMEPGGTQQWGLNGPYYFQLQCAPAN